MRAMFEEVRLAGGQHSQPFEIVEVGVEPDLPQGDHYFHPLQSCELAVQKYRALGEFSRQRLVVGRSATHCCGDVQIFQLETVVAISSVRLISESRLVEHGIHE